MEALQRLSGGPAQRLCTGGNARLNILVPPAVVVWRGCYGVIMDLHRAPTEPPESFFRASAELPRSLHRASSEAPQSLHRPCVGLPESLCKASTEPPQSLQRVPQTFYRAFAEHLLSFHSLHSLSRASAESLHPFPQRLCRSSTEPSHPGDADTAPLIKNSHPY